MMVVATEMAIKAMGAKKEAVVRLCVLTVKVRTGTGSVIPGKSGVYPTRRLVPFTSSHDDTIRAAKARGSAPAVTPLWGR